MSYPAVSCRSGHGPPLPSHSCSLDPEAQSRACETPRGLLVSPDEYLIVVD